MDLLISGSLFWEGTTQCSTIRKNVVPVTVWANILDPDDSFRFALDCNTKLDVAILSVSDVAKVPRRGIAGLSERFPLLDFQFEEKGF